MAATVVLGSNATLELLNIYNYDDWSLRVEIYLIAEGLWDVIDGTAKTPSNDDAEYMNWKTKNAKALHAIHVNCRTDVLGFICRIKIAKDAWKTLENRLKPRNVNISRDIKGMAGTLVLSEMLDLKPLDKDNYEDWSILVKTYLVAENLWEVVEDTREPPKRENGKAVFMTWQKCNARALHVIILFCGEACIKDIEIAKDAWVTLANKFAPPEISEILGGVNAEVDSDDDDNSSSNSRNAFLNMEGEIEAASRNELESMMDRRDWGAVREFFRKHPEALRANMYGGTPLHYAIIYDMVGGVKELLKLMNKKDLYVVDENGDTAVSKILRRIETDSRTEIFKCIIGKNEKLLLRAVRPSLDMIPHHYVLTLDRPKLTEYLYSDTPIERLMTRDAAELVSTCFRNKRLDIALKLLERFPNLIITKDRFGETPFNELADTRAELFPNVEQFGICKRLIYHCINIPDLMYRHAPRTTEEEGNCQLWKLLTQTVKYLFGPLFICLRCLTWLTGIDDMYQIKLLRGQTDKVLSYMDRIPDFNNIHRELVEKALFQAVERGHVDIIRKVCRSSWYSKSWLATLKNENDTTLLQFAVEHRRVEIFQSIYDYLGEKERDEIISRKDKFGNNMVHVAAKLSPLTRIAHIRGAAMQMQSELQWFMRIERLASPMALNCINFSGRTPREEFTVNHRDLVEAGEKSMKETATSSSALVAALIITIMFAAVVTVPGGIDGNSGIPIYLKSKAFDIFMVADVISLCSATTSVMVFLGILTSRFSEEDFLTSLPTKLIIGFLTLFLSIGSMMVAFSSAVFIMLPKKPFIVILSIVLCSVPIASFLWLQFPFLLEIIKATYDQSFWFIFLTVYLPIILFWFPLGLVTLCVMTLRRWIRNLLARDVRNTRDESSV